MTTGPAPPRTDTLAPVTDGEYLARERDPKTILKSDLLYGETKMMAGGTHLHANLPTMISGFTFGAVMDSGCASFSSDLKIRIPGAGYHYPDLSFAYEPEFEGDDVLLNPHR